MADEAFQRLAFPRVSSENCTSMTQCISALHFHFLLEGSHCAVGSCNEELKEIREGILQWDTIHQTKLPEVLHTQQEMC